MTVLPSGFSVRITGTCHLRWVSRDPADPDRAGPPTSLSVYFAFLAQVAGVAGLRTATQALSKAGQS